MSHPKDWKYLRLKIDDDLIELWIQKDYEAWVQGKARGSWKFEKTQQKEKY